MICSVHEDKKMVFKWQSVFREAQEKVLFCPKSKDIQFAAKEE